jgi:hypothetical protein
MIELCLRSRFGSFGSGSVSAEPVPLLLRQNAQDLVKGRQPLPWKHDDYAVLDDETRIGRIYRDHLPVGRQVVAGSFR